MADWKLPVSYSYNPSYHAYAYGLVYPQGPDQTHANLNWTDAYSHPAGVTGGFYAQPAQHSPPGSPESRPATNVRYPSSLLHLNGSQTHTQHARHFPSQNRTEYHQQTKEGELVNSDTPSDTEAHTPDSWSTASSNENLASQTNQDLSDWLKKDACDDIDAASPESNENISISRSVGEYFISATPDPEDVPPPRSNVAQSPPEQTTAPARKAKARTSFSNEQMSALTRRFNVQRYLTPAEMRTLADLTGLTYKQVKTWFQNRRMKLKRHQKDSSWVSERAPSTGYAGLPHAQVGSIPPDLGSSPLAATPRVRQRNLATEELQTEGPRLIQDPYSQFREAIFRKSPPKAPSLYPGQTHRHSPSQGVWPLTPGLGHYEYPRPAGYLPNNGSSDDGTLVDGNTSPTQMALVNTAPQWAS